MDTFTAELRRSSLSCNFGESVEDNVLDQVIEKCYDYLGEKLLQQGDTLTQEKAQTLGRATEQDKKDTLLLGERKLQSYRRNLMLTRLRRCLQHPTKSSHALIDK